MLEITARKTNIKYGREGGEGRECAGHSPSSRHITQEGLDKCFLNRMRGRWGDRLSRSHLGALGHSGLLPVKSSHRWCSLGYPEYTGCINLVKLM